MFLPTVRTKTRGTPARPIALRRWIRALIVPALLLTSSSLVSQTDSPAGPVPVERLEDRRQALRVRMGTGIAVLRGASQLDDEADGDYPQAGGFRQDNDFFYLTGLEEPDGWLVLVAGDSGESETILYLPPRNPGQEQWTGHTLGPGPEARALSGIADIRPATEAEAELPSLIARHRRLWLKLHPRSTARPEIQRLMFESNARAIEDLRPLLVAGRLVKDPDEVGRLRRAAEITTEAQREVLRSAVPGQYEYEMEAGIEAVFRRRGAERLGFPSIVGSGPNTTILHYDRNRRRTQAGDLVVTDVGAEFGYYTADVTRTWPVSGKFTPRQRSLYDLVLATQQVGIDSVRPGMTIGELDRIARLYMREHSAGLCGPQSCDLYFVHGLSHWLGMDVHDVGNAGTPLAPGMVLTVEPGIYLAKEGIGIRIEDDVLVTATGHDVLSAGAPRAAADIERLMAEGARLRREKH